MAGKRAGLDGERSGLFMEQIRVIKEMRADDKRNGRSGRDVRPRYMVWENVCGAFSSNGGKDFQAVLTEIVRIVSPECPDVPMPEKGGWSKCGSLCGVGEDEQPFSVAWRVHDAQYHGVPQRRKRLCVLADFNGYTAPSILFDPQFERTTEDGQPHSIVGHLGEQSRPEICVERGRLRGYSAAGEESGQGTAGAVGNGFGGADREIESAETFRKTAHPMNAEQGQGYEHTDVCDTLNVFDNSEVRTPTLIKQSIGGGGTTYQPERQGSPSGACSRDLQTGGNDAGRIDSYGFKPWQGSKAKGIGFGREVAPTLPAGVETAVLIRKNE